MTDKKTTEMNLLERLNRKKRQASMRTIANTLGKAFPAKGKLLKITEHISQLGNTPEEWLEQNTLKKQKELNNIRKQFQLEPNQYTKQQANKTIKELTPLINQFDGSNKTMTNYYIGLPQEEPAKGMLKQLKEVIK